VVATASDGKPLTACLASALGRSRLPAGRERLYQIQITLNSLLPSLTVEVEGVPGPLPGLARALTQEALDARRCLPARIGEASLPRLLLWSARPAQKRLALSWAPDP